MKLTIPHIHKIEGEVGFWAEITKKGKVEKLKIETLLGLREIERILIGRRYFEAPIVVSRICGVCPIPHSLAACCALEKALGVKVSPLTVLLRKLLLSAGIIHSHTLHLFFLSLPDFFDIENDLVLLKKFPKETKIALEIRNLALKICKVVGGRAVHPITPKIGGFSKIPQKEKLKEILKEIPKIKEKTQILIETFKKINYPSLKRKTIFVSLFSKKEYPFYESPKIKVKEKEMTIGDFYSVEIKEDLKSFPVKRVKFKGKPFMVGAVARLKNNLENLSPLAKENLKDFFKIIKKEEFFENRYFNIFAQAIEILHFWEESEKLIKKILKTNLKEKLPKIKFKRSSGLGAIEAPRGTLFHYYEINKEGRITFCNIITPSAQFLNNIEEDLKVLLKNIASLSLKEKEKKIKSLIRAYDPCISCATH